MFIYYVKKYSGSELVSPWGLIQKSLKVKPFEKDSQPVIKEDEEHSIRSDDLEERVKHLEKLNRFYQEYVITVPTSDSIKAEEIQQSRDECFDRIFHCNGFFV